jgi:hypothetical protein
MNNCHGSQVPTYSWCVDYKLTEGIQAAALSEAYDLKLHPWQKTVLNDWLAVDENGKLINAYCVLEVPRQNGKTGVSDPRETWGLVARGEKILHTAQEFQTAKKAFDRLRKKFGTRKNDPLAEYPELNAMVDRYTVSAGQMILDLKNHAHIEFRTRGSNSDMGRGGTFDLVVIDEAQSYTEAQNAALSPLNSAAPSGSPQTILMGTPPTPEAAHKGVIFSKNIDIMRAKPKAGRCIHEWSVDKIGNVYDKKRWYDCNPSLGYQLLENALENDAISMSEDSFAREHLGYMPKNVGQAETFLDISAWNACASTEKKPEGKTAYGVKFSPDGMAVALCGAVITNDKKARISLIQEKTTEKGIAWLADWLNERNGKASCVVIDGRNGVDLLIDRIAETWHQKNAIIRPKVKDVIAAASLLSNAVNEKTLTWYKYQEVLDDSSRTSVKRPMAGGVSFGGKHTLPIEACALALWGAKTSKRDPRRRMRIG